MKLWIGCSGWQYNDWQEKFYPQDYPKSKWLEFYATQFNTVEINYSFYHFPTADIIQKWYELAPKNFRYSLKVPRTITHYKKFHDTRELIQNFYQLADQLKEKLGCILFQFPPNIHYREDILKQIIEQLDKNQPNVIEFRHASWWQDKVFDTLKEANICFCSVNAPKLPEDIIQNTDILYLRLHGKKEWFQGHYSQRDLQQQIEAIRQHRFKEAWIYFNNDLGASAPLDAKLLVQLFGKS